jgi:hypothetical protein
MARFTSRYTFYSILAVQKFDSHERPELDHVLDEGVSAVRAVIVLGMEKAMSGQRL